LVRLKEFFDFSKVQLRFLLALALLAGLLSVSLLVRAYTVEASQGVDLPVILGDPDRKLTGTFVLDPNTAPVDSLELLPGIGKVLADRIVEYRQHHSFEREVDITDVHGIGPKLYERIQPYLCIKRP
jgi:DNA uptake protein ComE-like DNA-binding protein